MFDKFSIKSLLFCDNISCLNFSNFIIFIQAFLANKNQGPGSIQHSGKRCIHVDGAAYNRPNNGQPLLVYQGCGEEQTEFQLWPNGSLMLTRHGMCVKPTGQVTNGVRVSKLGCLN
jgi:hypothetical protein